MFSLEFTSGRPLGSAPYYSLVVREPYLVGRARGADIFLDHGDIVLQHASLTVMRQSQAEHHQREYVRLRQRADPSDPSANWIGDEVGVDGTFLNDDVIRRIDTDDQYNDYSERAIHVDAFVSQHTPSASEVLRETDPLVVRIVNLHEGGIISSGDQKIIDEPAYLSDGAQICFGAHVCLRLRFRPLVVSIARNAFSAEYVLELEFMYHRLGATLTRQCGPTSRLDMAQPIGLLYCTETVDDDPWCLMALACGYSAVQPTYVFEWFAALAQSAASPLSVLPPPVRFEVPIQCQGTHAHAALYLRPESDACPFPLYPIPSTSTLKRARDTLFQGRGFIFLTHAVEQRYRVVLSLCGGEIRHLEEVLSSTAAQNANKAQGPDIQCEGKEAEVAHSNQDQDQHEDEQVNGHSLLKNKGDEAKPNDCVAQTPANLYAVVDLDMEAAMQRHDSCGYAAVRQIVEDVRRAGLCIPLISERSLFHALLTNRFTICEVAFPPHLILEQQQLQELEQPPERHMKLYRGDQWAPGWGGYGALASAQGRDPPPFNPLSRVAGASIRTASHDGCGSSCLERPSPAATPSKARRVRPPAAASPRDYRPTSPPAALGNAHGTPRRGGGLLSGARRNHFADPGAGPHVAGYRAQVARLAAKAGALRADVAGALRRAPTNGGGPSPARTGTAATPRTPRGRTRAADAPQPGPLGGQWPDIVSRLDMTRAHNGTPCRSSQMTTPARNPTRPAQPKAAAATAAAMADGPRGTSPQRTNGKAIGLFAHGEACRTPVRRPATPRTPKIGTPLPRTPRTGRRRHSNAGPPLLVATPRTPKIGTPLPGTPRTGRRRHSNAGPPLLVATPRGRRRLIHP